MQTPPPLNLSAEDKLDILRKLDEFHFWHSLDDRRSCKQCGHAISGREIEVVEVAGTRGKMRLRCPTDGCLSTPGDWIYADPVLAASLRREFRSVGSQPAALPEDTSLTHHGHVVSIRRERHRSNEHAATNSSHARARRWRSSFRALLTRLPMLRPLATGFRAFHPIA
jgi:hypothetical protein